MILIYKVFEVGFAALLKMMVCFYSVSLDVNVRY